MLVNGERERRWHSGTFSEYIRVNLEDSGAISRIYIYIYMDNNSRYFG